MMRGYTWFRCPHCGTIFRAPDMEDNATVFSMRMPCPACGTENPAAGCCEWIQALVEKIIR